MPKLPANEPGKEKNVCLLFYKPRHQSQTQGQVREVQQRRMEHNNLACEIEIDSAKVTVCKDTHQQSCHDYFQIHCIYIDILYC